MNVPLIARLAKKDVRVTVREPYFFFYLAFPLLMTLVITVALGSLGGSVPSLGVCQDDAAAAYLSSSGAVDVATYPSIEAVREAVASGDRDGGLMAGEYYVLLYAGDTTSSERAALYAAVSSALAAASGSTETVDISVERLEPRGLSLQVRLIPFLVIIAAVVGGLIISSSLIEEREHHTLDALFVSPATPFDVIAAKALFGLFLGMVLGLLILGLNGALTSALVVVFLFFGVLFTIGIGLMAGVVMNSMTDLIARMKLFNIVLQFPALVILFPQIPSWLGMLFPTHYFIAPIISLTQEGAALGDVWWKLVVLVLCDAAVLVMAAKVLRRRMFGMLHLPSL